MKKEIVCIECPNGCLLYAVVKGSKVVSVTGHTCEKGEKYAYAEIEQPERVLTSTFQITEQNLTLISRESMNWQQRL